MSKQNKIKQVAFAALFTGLLTVFSQIYIPFAIPVTLQVFIVCLCGYTLEAKWGSTSVLVYIILGAVGLPVFSGFKGGFSVLFELTGGFIIGFIPLVFLCGLTQKTSIKFLKIILSLIGLLICHLCGVIQFAIISKTDLWVSLLTVSLPYIVKDIILTVMANLVSKYIKEKMR